MNETPRHSHEGSLRAKERRRACTGEARPGCTPGGLGFYVQDSGNVSIHCNSSSSNPGARQNRGMSPTVLSPRLPLPTKAQFSVLESVKWNSVASVGERFVFMALTR